MQFRIGCSGWSYKHWRGDFYPEDLRPARWLEYYCRQFDTVELNNTFYRLPSETAVRGWRDRTPPEFAFAVKVSRYVTHILRFREAEEAMERFRERMAPLAERPGPFLYQAPPTLQRDDALLAHFLAQLPEGRVHAFEFRHSSWWVEPVFELLREHGAAFVVYNMGEMTTPVVATRADVYVRMHGPEAQFASAYGEERLREWVERLAGLAGAERAWVYFNNDVGGHAPRDAARMRELAAERAPAG